MLPHEQDDYRPIPSEAPRVYVYGIVRADIDAQEPSQLRGIGGDPVRTVVADDLAALTGTPGASFDDDLKDPEQTKRLILDHHRVLQTLVSRRTVLPMRFGVLFADDDKVRDVLKEHHRGLVEALERVDGAREWGVKVFSDRAALRNHLGEASTAMRAARSELAAASQGRAFFLQRKVERLSEEEIDCAITHDVDDIRVRLSTMARADTAMKIQPAAVHGRTDDMAANDAYLVSEHGEECFFAILGELRRELEPRGFHIEANGPWPPFSFATCRLGD